MKTERTCVKTVNGEVEAQQVKAFLNAHDIPCELRGEALRTTFGFTLDGLGVVQIHVPEEYVAQARELLARVDAGELALHSRFDEPPEPDEAPER